MGRSLLSAEIFKVSETNPNEGIGGAGCVCSPTKVKCDGPYAVFYGCETDSNVSPHVVLSLACAEAFVRQAGPEPVDAEVVPVKTTTKAPQL